MKKKVFGLPQGEAVRGATLPSLFTDCVRFSGNRVFRPVIPED